MPNCGRTPPDLLEKAITHFAQAVHYSDTNGRIWAANNLRKEIKAYAIATIEAQGVPESQSLAHHHKANQHERNEMKTTELKKLAEAVKGWKLRDVNQTAGDREEGVAFVGHQSDVGIFDYIARIDTCNYMQPQAAIQIANYYAACNPAAILKLLAINAELVEALKTFVENQMTVGQRYTNEGQALLDAIAKAEGGEL